MEQIDTLAARHLATQLSISLCYLLETRYMSVARHGRAIAEIYGSYSGIYLYVT